MANAQIGSGFGGFRVPTGDPIAVVRVPRTTARPEPLTGAPAGKVPLGQPKPLPGLLAAGRV